MFLIVGLGNPGAKYEETRHNIGFKATDEIVRRFSLSSYAEKFSALVSKGEINGHKVVVIKPQTFMNNSGQAVQKAAAFFKILPENIIVIHDELDLDPLKLRIKTGGGNGGHNGLKSIQQCLGTPNFVRVRMGIGHPGHKDAVTPYVLGCFSKQETLDFETFCTCIANEIPQILEGRPEKAVSNVAHFMNLSQNLL